MIQLSGEGQIYLLSAFSLNMLPEAEETEVRVVEAHKNILRLLCPVAINAIGHADTDKIVRQMLQKDDIGAEEGQRLTVKMLPGDIGVVAQYCGPRLREGATELPYGAEIKFKVVEVR